MTLDYYNGDYQRSTDFSLLTSGTNQYNGNIKGMTWNTKTAAGANNPFQYSYQYNKNNWLTEANFNANGNVQPNTTPEDLVLNTAITAPMNAEATHSITLKPGFKATNNFSAKIVAASTTNDPFSSEDYKVHGITYDANGNIQTLNRNKNTEEINGFTSNKMDELSYHYKTDKPNQLKRVGDAITQNTNANDIKDQTTENNYIYNSIGQLTENKDENVRYEYNASGLVTKVYYNNYLKVQFYYNDKGYRTKKVGYQDNSSTLDKTTYYVLDAAGSPLAIYEDQQQVELPIYGASRLGVYKKASNTSVYQLTDHLGNVRAVIAKEASGNQSNIRTIFNDDLESSTGWDSTGALYGTSATLSTEHAKSGTHSVKIVNPNYNQYQYAHSNSWIPINNEITTDYIFSGWFYSTGPRVRFVFFMNENEETAYYTDTESSAVSSSRNQWEYIEKRVSVPPNIDKINFRIGAFGGGYDSAGTVWYDDLKIEEIKTGATLVSATDYYSFGMPMPNRQIVNGEPYRYAFQGQEKDPETGKEAFQLRLWDGRIGRWLTTDPYGQYHSPYMGMGNNPITRVDPDGGFDWYKDADGNYAYDSNLTAENASSFLGAGETYVGESFYDFNALQGGSIDGIMTNLFDGSQTQFLAPITVFASSKTWDAVSNRRIKTLDSRLQQPATKFINLVERELGIQLRMTQAFRTFAEQDALYAKGRTKSGKIVTNARGGRSYHNYGLALDVVIMDNGKTPNWSALSPKAAQIGIDLGFEWGGNWRKFKDYPHFQMIFNQTTKQLLSVHNGGKK
jgi:RHS repeat-associated protein